MGLVDLIDNLTEMLSSQDNFYEVTITGKKTSIKIEKSGGNKNVNKNKVEDENPTKKRFNFKEIKNK